MAGLGKYRTGGYGRIGVYRVKEKTGADGTTECYKALLVAQCFSQKHGLDYDETFSPVVRTESVHSMIALAISYFIKWIWPLLSSMGPWKRRCI